MSDLDITTIKRGDWVYRLFDTGLALERLYGRVVRVNRKTVTLTMESGRTGRCNMEYFTGQYKKPEWTTPPEGYNELDTLKALKF